MVVVRILVIPKQVMSIITNDFEDSYMTHQKNVSILQLSFLSLSDVSCYKSLCSKTREFRKGSLKVVEF